MPIMLKIFPVFKNGKIELKDLVAAVGMNSANNQLTVKMFLYFNERHMELNHMSYINF